jgi:hypothetical protein
MHLHRSVNWLMIIILKHDRDRARRTVERIDAWLAMRERSIHDGSRSGRRLLKFPVKIE